MFFLVSVSESLELLLSVLEQLFIDLRVMAKLLDQIIPELSVLALTQLIVNKCEVSWLAHFLLLSSWLNSLRRDSRCWTHCFWIRVHLKAWVRGLVKMASWNWLSRWIDLLIARLLIRIRVVRRLIVVRILLIIVSMRVSLGIIVLVLLLLVLMILRCLMISLVIRSLVIVVCSRLSIVLCRVVALVDCVVWLSSLLRSLIPWWLVVNYPPILFIVSCFFGITVLSLLLRIGILATSWWF